MICKTWKNTGAPSPYCRPDVGAYRYGCRCDLAKAAYGDYMRPHCRRQYEKRRAAMATVCPMCGSETRRASGFCKECEAER